MAQRRRAGCHRNRVQPLAHAKAIRTPRLLLDRSGRAQWADPGRQRRQCARQLERLQHGGYECHDRGARQFAVVLAKVHGLRLAGETRRVPFADGVAGGTASMDDPTWGRFCCIATDPPKKGGPSARYRWRRPRMLPRPTTKGWRRSRNRNSPMPRRTSRRPSRRIRSTPPRGTSWGCCRLARTRRIWLAVTSTRLWSATRSSSSVHADFVSGIAGFAWRALADVTDTLVKLDPFDYPQAFYFNSVAYSICRTLRRRRKRADRGAPRYAARNPRVNHILGRLLAMRRTMPARRSNTNVPEVRARCDGRRQSAGAACRDRENYGGQRGGERAVVEEGNAVIRMDRREACPTCPGCRECRGWRSPSW